jgi:hypothetical protein
MMSTDNRPLSKGMQLIKEYRVARAKKSEESRIEMKRFHLDLKNERSSASSGANAKKCSDIELSVLNDAVAGMVEYNESTSKFTDLLRNAASSSGAESIDGARLQSASESGPGGEVPDVIKDRGLTEEPTVNVTEKMTDCNSGRSGSSPCDPALAEVGFGPGMTIRLSQVGVQSIYDLAAADPGELREALGEISRIIDIDRWINIAKSRVTGTR